MRNGQNHSDLTIPLRDYKSNGVQMEVELPFCSLEIKLNLDNLTVNLFSNRSQFSYVTEFLVL